MLKIDKKILEMLQLSEAEMKIYVTALSLGEATIQSLSRGSSVKRTSIYSFIDRLVSRGILTETKKGKRNYFSACSPEYIFEREKERLNELEKELPSFHALYNSGRSHPKVSYYEGVDAVKALYEDTLKIKNSTIYALSDFEGMKKILGQRFINDYPIKRRNKEISFKTITEKNPVSQDISKRNIGELRDMKFLQTNTMKAEINIYGDKVSIVSFSEKPYAVLIEDPNLSKTLITVWHELWGKLK